MEVFKACKRLDLSWSEKIVSVNYIITAVIVITTVAFNMEEIINFDYSYKWQCKGMSAFGSCFLFCIIHAFRQNHVGISSSIFHVL